MSYIVNAILCYTLIMKSNYAFIDSQNLYLSVAAQGWKIDWIKFRTYLQEKYNVERAYLFIGYIEGNTSLYTELQASGFICVWKPTLKNKEGVVKGNCDAELVLHTMIQYHNFDKAIIVSGDGDFYCLIDYLIDQRKLETILIPNMKKYSALLKIDKFFHYRTFVSNLRDKIESRL